MYGLFSLHLSVVLVVMLSVVKQQPDREVSAGLKHLLSTSVRQNALAVA